MFLHKLDAWLRDEPCGWRFYSYIVYFALISVGYSLLTVAVEIAWKEHVLAQITTSSLFPLVAFFAIAAIAEEIMFRLPLALAAGLNFSLKSILVNAVVLSVVFAYAHNGFSSLPVQGITGIMFSLAFLKCGGYQGRPLKALKALMAVSMVHLSHNLVIALLIFMI